MAGKNRRTGRRRRTSPPWWAFVGAFVAAAVGVGTLIAIGASTGQNDEAGSDQIVMPSPLPAGLAHEGKLLGDPSAPVAIVEFADFQ